MKIESSFNDLIGEVGRYLEEIEPTKLSREWFYIMPCLAS